jgi:hypothetical protein
MITLQTYEQFNNSKDFERIYVRSESSLFLYYKDLDFFKNSILKSAISNNTIELFYKNNEVIGYFVYEIKKQIMYIHFYYICPKNRNRKYGRQLRSLLYEKLQHKFQNLMFSINKKNQVSINAARKTCLNLNLKINYLNDLSLHPRQFHFFVEKPLTSSQKPLF